ncbi:MAG: hypothetical protein JWO74_2038 [Solirubrobacterales bacterium]|nr:hypothetical protein [Solirubrobacterales bacterium]
MKLDAEQGPPTADAFANERSRAAQLASDVRVIRLIDDPPPDRLPLIGCEVLERGERCRAGGVGAQRLDPLEGLLADLDVFHAQRATRAILHDATPPTVDQLAARDREQARDRLRDVDRPWRRQCARAAANVSAARSAETSASNVRRMKNASTAAS